MSNKKKIFIVAYITILVIISTMLINKISATGSVQEDGEEWISLSWGWYQVTEDGEETDSKNYPQVIGKGYKDKAAVDQQLSTSRFYYKTKSSSSNNSEYYNWSVFCIQKGEKLINESQDTTSSTSELDETDGGNAGIIYEKVVTGNEVKLVPLKINGKEVRESDATNTLTDSEIKALEPTVSSAKAGSKYIKTTGEMDSTATAKKYVSKGITDASGKINVGKSTFYATELPDGETEIKFSNGQTYTRDGDTQPLPWGDAFIFANVSKEDQAKQIQDTDAQHAIWALGYGDNKDETGKEKWLNTGTKPYSYNGDILKKAKLFRTYKDAQEERESDKPKLVEENQDQYKYKFVLDGNYLIAGPVQIVYGPLTVKEGGTELEVGKVEGLTVYGLRGDNNELVDITEHIKFTDESGNELSGDNKIITTAKDKNGKECKFPASNQEFYIRLDYDKMKSLGNIKAINSIEVKFKELDVRAVGAKISDVKTYETEWYASNVMYENCTPTETGGGTGTGGEIPGLPGIPVDPGIPGGGTTITWGGIPGCIQLPDGTILSPWGNILYNPNEVGGGSGLPGLPGIPGGGSTTSGVACVDLGNGWWTPVGGGQLIVPGTPGYYLVSGLYSSSEELRGNSNGFSDEIRSSSTLDSFSRILGAGTTTHLKNNCTSTTGATHSPNDTQSYGVLIKGDVKSTGSDEQNLFVLFAAEMYWRKYKLVILFGPENTPPETPTSNPPAPWTSNPPVPWTSNPPAPWTSMPPPGGPSSAPITGTPSPDTGITGSPSHPTYVDIGGKVWVDAEDTKEGTGNNNEYNEGKDYARENVKVTLYDESGNVVGKDLVADYARNDFKNPTWTDKNGNYTFKQLSIDHKYYVEFTYDGMTYETVDFLKGKDPKSYMNDPNNESYNNISKAAEKSEERGKFNSRFEEIQGNGPGSLSSGHTAGKTANGDILNYKSDNFKVNGSTMFQSRLLTTTEESDVEKLWSDGSNGRERGIARRASDANKGNYRDDYEMSVNTKESGIATFPFGEKEYIIFSADKGLVNEFNYLQHIDLGLKRREKADLSIAVDIKAGGTAIKDTEFTKLVTFRSNQEEKDMLATVTAEQTDAYLNYKKQYKKSEIVQDIAGTDYWWLANLDGVYGDKNIYTDEDGLNVYVLYKIILKNYSEGKSIDAKITGLVDYFSDGLMLPTEEGDQDKINKIFKDYGIQNSNSYSWVDNKEKNYPKVEWEEQGKTNGYNTLKTKKDKFELDIGESGSDEAIYLVLKVKRDETKKLVTGETDELKNITEITSYKLEKNGKPAGLVDCDSAPHNAKPGDKNTYEDDTDDAPVFKLNVVKNAKVIEGDVWEDLGENVRGQNINNVKVELVEYIYKNGEVVDQVTRPGLTITNNGNSVGVEVASNKRTGADGQKGHYKFYVEGGNYAIKFTYGDAEMLQSPDKKYNGQDYQASTYKPLSVSEYYNIKATNGNGEPIIINKAVATTSDLKEYLKHKELLRVGDFKDKNQIYWETNNWQADTSGNKDSNARDLASIRQEIIANAMKLTNENATWLNELNEDKEMQHANELSGYDHTPNTPNYTYMEAISDIVVVESNDLAEFPKTVNLALRERPQASMKLDKKIERIVVRTNDGVALIDTNDTSKLSNVQDLTPQDAAKKFQDTFINMDAISMDGATIDIDYTITVTNDGVADKLSNYVYVDSDKSEFESEKLQGKFLECFGRKININEELPVKANTIYDYVNINLEFRADDNKEGEFAIWEKVYDEDVDLKFVPDKENWVTMYVKEGLDKENVRKVSKVLETTKYANNRINDLYTSEDNKTVTIPVHLGITLAENTVGDFDDAFAYSNCAEIIEVYSGPGRRDYETIPGNYVPYDTSEANNKEEDAQLTGTSVITPPLGEGRIYYVIAIVSATIIIAGIIIIKKKVLKK